jgi:hypothetical protein
VRGNLKGRLKLIDRFVDAAMVKQEVSEAIVCEKIP